MVDINQDGGGRRGYVCMRRMFWLMYYANSMTLSVRGQMFLVFLRSPLSLEALYPLCFFSLIITADFLIWVYLRLLHGFFRDTANQRQVSSWVTCSRASTVFVQTSCAKHSLVEAPLLWLWHSPATSYFPEIRYRGSDVSPQVAFKPKNRRCRNSISHISAV